MKTSRAIPTTRPPQGANHCWLGGVVLLMAANKLSPVMFRAILDAWDKRIPDNDVHP